MLQMAAERVGWEVVMNRGGAVIWVDILNEAESRIASRNEGEWVSWIPGVSELCGKLALDAVLQARGARFWPRCWRVPPDNADAIGEQAFRGGGQTTLIVKPDEGSQGSGIGLAQSRKDLERLIRGLPPSGAIVQEYIDRPLLVDGCKWDARIYVLMLRSPDGHFAVFLAQEGLVRVCSEAYAMPQGRNLHKTSIHLTNYSLSKFADNCEHAGDPEDATQGCKRTLSAVLQRLEGEGVREAQDFSAAAVWDGLAVLSRATVSAIAEELEATYEARKCELPEHTFHVLGLDVLLDAAGRPWLLEANHRPSLLIDEVHPLPAMSRADMNRFMAAAKPRGGGRWGKPCRCSLHHRLHEHHLGLVDAAVKSPVIEGALQIVQRAKRGDEFAAWAEGTIYRLV